MSVSTKHQVHHSSTERGVALHHQWDSAAVSAAMVCDLAELQSTKQSRDTLDPVTNDQWGTRPVRDKTRSRSCPFCAAGTRLKPSPTSSALHKSLISARHKAGSSPATQRRPVRGQQTSEFSRAGQRWRLQRPAAQRFQLGLCLGVRWAGTRRPGPGARQAGRAGSGLGFSE